MHLVFDHIVILLMFHMQFAQCSLKAMGWLLELCTVMDGPEARGNHYKQAGQRFGGSQKGGLLP